MNIPGFTGEASLCHTNNYRLADVAGNSVGGREVLPQLPPDIYTTGAVCQACGCTASDVACDCGTPPDPRKLDCINNGGPTRAMPVFSGLGMGGIGRGIFRAS
jgi:hypothetical protein